MEILPMVKAHFIKDTVAGAHGLPNAEEHCIELFRIRCVHNIKKEAIAGARQHLEQAIIDLDKMDDSQIFEEVI